MCLKSWMPKSMLQSKSRHYIRVLLRILKNKTGGGMWRWESAQVALLLPSCWCKIQALLLSGSGGNAGTATIGCATLATLLHWLCSAKLTELWSMALALLTTCAEIVQTTLHTLRNWVLGKECLRTLMSTVLTIRHLLSSPSILNCTLADNYVLWINKLCTK